MQVEAFLDILTSKPEQITFDDTIAMIEANYTFTPTAFHNGELHNEEDQNNGSCKILFFGLIHELGESHTLACFGKFYREDVLFNPGGDDHQNIRNFMRFGWERVSFNGEALSPKH